MSVLPEKQTKQKQAKPTHTHTQKVSVVRKQSHQHRINKHTHTHTSPWQQVINELAHKGKLIRMKSAFQPIKEACICSMQELLRRQARQGVQGQRHNNMNVDVF